MRTLPFPIGTFHFIGIGGIGMSAIAEILKHLGYSVQGSDVAQNDNIRRLQAQGIKVYIGHHPHNIDDADIVIISSAISEDNPEIHHAHQLHIPVIRRAQMLAELMRMRWAIAVGGTHGKTTTTSLIATLLEADQKDPTVINGGIISSYGSNTRLGQGDWMVVESDESDGSFVNLPSIVSVVTSMDCEHMDHWKTPENMRHAYYRFITNIPFYGYAVLCADHPALRDMIPHLTQQRLVTYGCHPGADICGEDIDMNKDGATFYVRCPQKGKTARRRLGPFHLPMYGRHNIQNALASIAIAWIMDIPEAVIKGGLGHFQGVKRRFTCTGQVDGITFIDDYAHHPTEIRSCIRAARQAGARRVIVVMQPHRYSRVKNLLNEFSLCLDEADIALICDIYAGGEAPLVGINKETLIRALREHGHQHVKAAGTQEELARDINDIARQGDYILCVGAGSITCWARELPEQVAALRANSTSDTDHELCL